MFETKAKSTAPGLDLVNIKTRFRTIGVAETTPTGPFGAAWTTPTISAAWTTLTLRSTYFHPSS